MTLKNKINERFMIERDDIYIWFVFSAMFFVISSVLTVASKFKV